MKLKSKKTMIIGAISMILLVVLGIFGNQYLNEKANREKAIEIAKSYNFNTGSILNKDPKTKTLSDWREKYSGTFPEDIVLEDPNTFKDLGWNSKKVVEDVYYTTLSYRYANSDDIYVIAFQVNLNLNKCTLINQNSQLIDYYKKHNFIKDNHVLKTYEKLLK